MNEPRNEGRRVTVGLPVRYRLLDREGIAFGPYPTAHAAALMASDLWPDQRQDPDRTGTGWDIEVIQVTGMK